MKLKVEFHNKPWKLSWCLHHLCIEVLSIFVLLISWGQDFVLHLLNQSDPSVDDRALSWKFYLFQTKVYALRETWPIHISKIVISTIEVSGP